MKAAPSPMTARRKADKKPNATVISTTVLMAGILGVFLALYVREASLKKKQIDTALQRTAAEMNKRFPAMADPETRVDKVAAGPGERLVYFITLPNETKDDINVPVFQNAVRQKALANYQTNARMSDLRNNNVILEMKYVDKNGEAVTETSVSPRDF